MDDLKKYIDANRDEYELYEAPADLWDQIELKLDKKKQAKPASRWIWSGVAAILIGLGTVIGMMYWNENPTNVQANNSVPNELLEVEVYYQDLIAIKVNQISAIEPDQSIFQDIDLLDVAFTELKEDLKDNADNEEVINAMIANYQVKLKILERVLEELKRKKEIK